MVYYWYALRYLARNYHASAFQGIINPRTRRTRTTYPLACESESEGASMGTSSLPDESTRGGGLSLSDDGTKLGGPQCCHARIMKRMRVRAAAQSSRIHSTTRSQACLLGGGANAKFLMYRTWKVSSAMARGEGVRIRSFKMPIHTAAP